jgi:hypothetical protein
VAFVFGQELSPAAGFFSRFVDDMSMRNTSISRQEEKFRMSKAMQAERKME